MKKFPIFLLFISLLVFLTVSYNPKPTIVYADATCDSSSCTDPDLGKHLSCVNEILNKCEDQLRSTQAQEKSLKTQLNLIDGQMQVTNLKIEQTNLKIEKLKREISDLLNRIDRIGITLNALSEVLLQRIVQTYKYSNDVSTLNLLFSSRGFTDLIEKLKYVQVAQAYNKQKLYELQATKLAYNDQKQDKQTRQQEAEKLNKDLATYKTQLDQQKNAKDELLKVTKNDEAKYQQEIARLRADTDSIRRALGGAGVKIGPVKKGDTIASVGNSGCSTGPHLHFEVMVNASIENNSVIGRENKVDPKPYLAGQLGKPLDSYTGQACGSYPCHGGISTYFGASGDDYIKGFPPHTGLDLPESMGTPIKAAADGIAYQLSDSRSCSLTGTTGKGIVLDHDNSDIVTLYWHIP